MSKPVSETQTATTDINLAHVFLEARNFPAVEKIALQRLSDDPQDLHGHLLLVSIAQRLTDHGEALVRVRRALAYHPMAVALRTIEVTTLLHLRRKTDAREKIENFRQDFRLAGAEVHCFDLIFASVFRSIKSIHALSSKPHAPLFGSQLSAYLSGAGGYVEAEAGLRKDAHEHPNHFGFLIAAAYNQLMLCKFGEARTFARRALALKPRRFEKRVIACSYLFCVPTIFYAHLVYVAWRMAIGYFQPIIVSAVFLLAAPLLYLPLFGFAKGWAAIGLPFGGAIAIGSVLIHALSVFSFEPRIASWLADKGKPLKLVGY